MDEETEEQHVESGFCALPTNTVPNTTTGKNNQSELLFNGMLLVSIHIPSLAAEYSPWTTKTMDGTAWVLDAYLLRSSFPEFYIRRVFELAFA
jgi:hypothetical protein